MQEELRQADVALFAVEADVQETKVGVGARGVFGCLREGCRL